MIRQYLLSIIDHTDQRLPGQVGDWVLSDGGSGLVVASDLGNADMTFCLLLHELVELYLCQKAGIDQQTVDGWDQNYTGGYEEEGSDPGAPYHAQHEAASRIEKALAAELGVDWQSYDRAIQQVLSGYPPSPRD